MKKMNEEISEIKWAVLKTEDPQFEKVSCKFGFNILKERLFSEKRGKLDCLLRAQLVSQIDFSKLLIIIFIFNRSIS